MTTETEPMVRVVGILCAQRCERAADSSLLPEYHGVPHKLPLVVPVCDVRHPRNHCRYCGGRLEFATEPVR